MGLLDSIVKNTVSNAVKNAAATTVAAANGIKQSSSGSSGTGSSGVTASSGSSSTGGTDWSAQMQAAMDRGASADVVEYLMGQRNSKIAANQAHYDALGISGQDSISQAAQQYIQRQRAEQAAGQYGSLSDYMADSGYSDYADQVRAMVQASVDQAVNGYKGQIDTTNEQSDAMARQAWVNKKLAEKNLNQQLAANGYAGGMADSQKIDLESSYQGQLTEIEKQRLQTIKELESAITNAQLAGDMQAAQELAGMLQQIQSQWSSYVQTQQQMNQQNYWNQQQMDNQNYWNEQELTAQNRENAYNRVLTLISQGFMPDEETLTTAGIDRTEAQRRLDQVLAAQQAALTTGGNNGTVKKTSTGRAYDNGSLTTAQVQQMQKALGVTPDGMWGSVSKQAAGGLSADQAWAQMNGGGEITQYDQLGPAAKQLLSNMQRNSARTGTGLLTDGRLEMVESALNNGEISNAEANYILDMIGT